MSVKSTVASTRSASGRGRVAGQELLDLVDDRVDVARPEQMLVAGQLDELCARDLPRDPASLVDVHVTVVGPVRGRASERGSSGSTARTSIWEFMRRSATAAPGLALRRR